MNTCYNRDRHTYFFISRLVNSGQGEHVRANICLQLMINPTEYGYERQAQVFPGSGICAGFPQSDACRPLVRRGTPGLIVGHTFTCIALAEPDILRKLHDVGVGVWGQRRRQRRKKQLSRVRETGPLVQLSGIEVEQ